MSYERRLAAGSNVAYNGTINSENWSLDYLGWSLGSFADCLKSSGGGFSFVQVSELGGNFKIWFKVNVTLGQSMTVGEVKQRIESAWDVCRRGWLDTWPQIQLQTINVDYAAPGSDPGENSIGNGDSSLSQTASMLIAAGAIVLLLFLKR